MGKAVTTSAVLCIMSYIGIAWCSQYQALFCDLTMSLVLQEANCHFTHKYPAVGFAVIFN